jgi:MSHA biogenesis protein MshG
MEVYEYVGRNRRGESIRGTVESASSQAVASWLMESEIFPVNIRLQQALRAERPDWLVKLFGDEKVSAVDLLLFTRQMANMMRAGMQVMDAVEGIQRTTASMALSKVLAQVRADLDRGVLLSAAFARHPGVFDDYYTNMIRVGESTGRLAEAFQSLYRQVDFDRSMQQKIRTALRYPMFVVIALTIAMAILTIFVIPRFAKTYASFKVELPFITRVLLNTSDFAVNYWWAVLGLAGAVWYMAQLWLASSEGRYAWDRFKLRIPVFGGIMNKAAIARFARSFATALEADVPIVQGFQLAANVVENAFFHERILQMRKGVERGEVLSRVMRTSGIFSPLELQLITVAEKTGEVEQAITELAKLYTDEVEYEVGRLAQTVEPLLLAGMGILVGIVVLGVFLPMWDMAQVLRGGH